jgi:hypothetical protein
LIEHDAAPLCPDDDRRAQAALLAARRELTRVRHGLGDSGRLATANEPTSEMAGEIDAAGPLLDSIARGSVTAALDAGLLGLVPEALGRAPGRRIHAFDHGTLIEDHGDVVRLAALSARAHAVLTAIAVGPRDRASLLQAAWGLKSYHPERHNSLIKTAVSRLRSALGHGGAWIVTDANAYGITAGVELMDHTSAGAGRARDAGDVPAMARDVTADARGLAYPTRWRELLALLAPLKGASVSDIARRTRTSLRTVSRELSAMHASGLIGRVGAGRGTRYVILASNHEVETAHAHVQSENA